MALVVSFNSCHLVSNLSQTQNPQRKQQRRRLAIANAHNEASDPDPKTEQVQEVDNIGVRAALTVLTFYKREISPMLLKSCRYVPTCSEYAMEAYKKYGFLKGSVLTTWRICRCNPLGGSGFDPPRWFDEPSLPEEE